MNVNFYDFKDVDDEKIKFAVIMTYYKGDWIFVKHKDRDTWEIPGGHREKNESINETASRELYEETGALKFGIRPVTVYSVDRGSEFNYDESFGALYYAEVQKLGKLPAFEIQTIGFFKSLPYKLTYPEIQPYLFKKIGNVYTLDENGRGRLEF